jgi:chromate transporter
MTTPRPNFGEALRFWWRLGWISFGGPTGQIAIMHRELVERRRWIDEKPFLHALNYCMLLPGPEATQLAIYIGWRLHGVRGGICAGVLFVLAAVFILWGLSLLYVEYGTVPLIAAAFYGLVPAIIAIVFNAMVKLGSKTLRDVLRWGIAIAAAVLITYFRGWYPAVVLGAGLVGWILGPREAKTATDSPTVAVPLGPQLRIAAICIAVWLAPLIAFGCWLGWQSTVAQEGIFFSKASLVTFGGAYAVLPYVAQHAVVHYQWLSAEQMLHGFGLAETTPGPLIMVLQFVGFMGAWKYPGQLSPLLAATCGSLLTTWVTFAPSFLFILAGAPYVERLVQLKALQSALTGVSAAVVGVMANFALWFAWQAVLPSPGHVDWFVVAVSLGAFLALLVWQVDVILLIGACATLGVAKHFFV